MTKEEAEEILKCKMKKVFRKRLNDENENNTIYLVKFSYSPKFIKHIHDIQENKDIKYTYLKDGSIIKE